MPPSWHIPTGIGRGSVPARRTRVPAGSSSDGYDFGGHTSASLLINLIAPLFGQWPHVVKTATDSFVKELAESEAKRLQQPQSRVSSASWMPKTAGTEAAIREAMIALVRRAESWSANIGSSAAGAALEFSTTYYELNVNPTQRTWNRMESDPMDRPVATLFGKNRHVVLLGDVGAGKTTALRRLTRSALASSENRGREAVPLVVLLRDLEGPFDLLNHIAELLRLPLGEPQEGANRQPAGLTIALVSAAMNHFRILLLLDGLDELPPVPRSRVIKSLRSLAPQLTNSTFVLTCRTAEFRYDLETQFDRFYLCPPTRDGIGEIARVRLGTERGRRFLERLGKTPYAGSELRPLILDLLLSLYARTGDIPESPRHVYRAIVRLFIREWDEDRGVRRVSAYAAFERDEKERFLQALAAHLTTRGVRAEFDQDALMQAFYAIRAQFALPESHAQDVAKELASHTGILMDGAKVGSYAFVHRSIQEYLCAEHLVRLPSLTRKMVLAMPGESALAVVLSSDPESYLAMIVDLLLKSPPSGVAQFVAVFIDRLRIERATFAGGVSAGASLLLLHSLVIFPLEAFTEVSADDDTRDTLDWRRTRGIIELFRQGTSVADQALEFLTACDVTKRDGSTYEVTGSAEALMRLPVGQRDWLERKGSQFFLDSDVYGALLGTKAP